MVTLEGVRSSLGPVDPNLRNKGEFTNAQGCPVNIGGGGAATTDLMVDLQMVMVETLRGHSGGSPKISRWWCSIMDTF